MKKKVIFALSFVLLALFAISSGVTVAWLTQQNKLPDYDFTVGEIKYTIAKDDSQTPTSPVVPGDALGNVTITNESNIRTNMRVLITVTATKATVPAPATPDTWTVGLLTTQVTTNTTDHLLLTLDDTNWVKGTDDYIYYKSQTDAEGIIEANGVVTSPFTKMAINGEVVGNDYEKANVKITITFQAKQYDNVTWETLGSINWDKGITVTQ